MLNLYFGPTLDTLTPILAKRLQGLLYDDPLRSPVVIVPSTAVGQWLGLQLTNTFGCIAGLRMTMLEHFLWETLQPDENTRPIDPSGLQQIVCAVLDRELLDNAVYTPLRRYLLVNGKIDPLKRVQLSARIARQFMEYEYNRPGVWHEGRWRLPGVDSCWLEGKDYFTGSDKTPGGRSVAAEHEAWQKDLYRRVHRLCNCDCTFKGRQENESHFITLPHLYRYRRERERQTGTRWSVVTGEIFLFGATKISHFHRNTFVEMSQMPGVNLNVFLTNPCAEFWEDVNTTRVRRTWSSGTAGAGIAPREPRDYNKEEFDFVKDQELLELWGRAGKENIFLWCPQAEWNFEYVGPDWFESGEKAESLLKKVQSALLKRQDTIEGPLTDDGSLRILACPDPRREIEELREQILDIVHEDPAIKLNDIAVYLPDPGAYTAVIQGVFDASQPETPEHIPVTILGTPGSDGIFSQGVRALLRLIEGRFDRPTVFEFLRNPILQASCRISADMVGSWAAWAEEVGIFRGYNREHRIAMGDSESIATDAHTFELGMARMLAGNLVSGPVQLGYSFLDSKEPVPLLSYRDFDTGDRGRLEAFCATIENIHTDICRFRSSADEVVRGIDFLTGLIWKWFGVIPDDRSINGPAEGQVRREFIDSIQSIRLQQETAGRKNIPLDELLALIEECLPEELSMMSSPWTGGVTFAPLRPAMIVPHRVIFAAGLDAKTFPGTSDRPQWDLISLKRYVGDSDRVRDHRFAFLELIHAARERLILSYRNRDMQKEEDLQPSSVVLELEAYLKKQGLACNEGPVGEKCAIRREIPWIIHESLDTIVKSGRAHGCWDASEIALAEQAGNAKRKAHRHELHGTVFGSSGIKSGEILFRTNIYNIRAFFRNPLEYHLSKTLGIELDEEPGAAGASDEPLDSGILALSNLQKKIWIELLRLVFPSGGKAIKDIGELSKEAEAISRKVYAEHAGSGHSPEAQFCRMERRALAGWAVNAAEVTLELPEKFPDHRLIENTDLSLGREAYAGNLTIAIHNTITCIIECRHEAVLVPKSWDTGIAGAGIINFKKNEKAGENCDLWLSGLVQSLSETRQVTYHLVQLNRDECGCDGAVMKAADDMREREKKEAWLRDILGSMLVRNCSDHLPYSIVKDLTKQNINMPLTWEERWGRVTGENIKDRLAAAYGYISYQEAFNLTDAKIPDLPDEELQRISKQRFAPILEGWFHE